MQKKILKYSFLLPIIAGFFISNTFALSCMQTTLDASLSGANSVFVGKVLQVDSNRATFEIAKSWKGNSSSQITTQNTTYWTGLPNGNIFFTNGESYIVATYLDPAGNERNSIDCSMITSKYSYGKEMEITNILGSPKNPNYPTQPVYPTPSSYCPKLYNNLWMGNTYNNRQEVRELQTYLFNYYSVGEEINATGFFGRLTKNYLTRFQRDHGISPTGGLGPITRAQIANICANGTGGGQTFCTAQYQPVCGQTSYGATKTFGNSCEMRNAGATYLYEGECRNNTTSEAPANCKIWYDGCNTCSRSTVGGPLMCTLMACFQNSGGYCREYFNSSTQAPTIKSFSGPVQLRVNEIGNWNISAESFNNQQLTYNITWGDERYESKMALNILPTISAIVPQNTSFQHSYMYPGNYTVIIEVRNPNGQSTKTTTSVNVTY